MPPFDPADFVNHSCDPNCGIVGSILLVTMRDIEAGEELCFDYAMTDSDDYDEFTCECDTGIVAVVSSAATTGSMHELQERYVGWFSSYLERQIGSGTH